MYAEARLKFMPREITITWERPTPGTQAKAGLILDRACPTLVLKEGSYWKRSLWLPWSWLKRKVISHHKAGTGVLGPVC